MSTLYQKSLAWSVHIFTASGILAAFLALIAVDGERWKEAFLWLVLCFVIDSLDGALARKVNASEVLPSMDGKLIDYVIDFTTYCIIPAYFFYKAEMVHSHLMYPSLAIILLSSALYYGKTGMVHDEQYFIGFPVLWNFVVFFQFFVLQNIPSINFWTVIVFGILHFIPIKFAYPSRSKKYFWIHLVVSCVGLVCTWNVLIAFPSRAPVMEWGAIAGATYFILFALADTFRS